MKQRSLVSNSLRVMNLFKSDSLPKPLDFKIYPNPANSYITIEGSLPNNVTQAKINVVNLSGLILKTDTYTGQVKTMDVHDLKPGMYLLEVRYAKDQKSVYKIVITE